MFIVVLVYIYPECDLRAYSLFAGAYLLLNFNMFLPEQRSPWQFLRHLHQKFSLPTAIVYDLTALFLLALAYMELGEMHFYWSLRRHIPFLDPVNVIDDLWRLWKSALCGK